MFRSKKAIIWASAILVTAMIVIVGFLYLNSTHYKVFKIEFEWDIDLPNQMKLEYEDQQVHIDGSVRYYVFTSKNAPSDEIFTLGDDVDKEVFESSFMSALEGFGVSSGKPNVPIEFIPNLNGDYDFMVLSGVTSSRFKFLYVIYQPSTQTIYICHQVVQYPNI